VVESKCIAVLSAESLARTKLQWSEKTIDARLAALYFADPALVRRAYTIQTKLYESELACYHRGMCSRGPGHYRDATGKAVVVNGLKYFQFEWRTGEPESQAVMPIALFVTRELVEDSDFFGYMERQLAGTRALFTGAPILRHRSLESVFEQTPNSWMEFERQLIQLIAVVLVKLEASESTSRGSRGEAASLSDPEQDRIASAAAFALLDLEEQDRAASQKAKDRNVTRKAKKKARLAEARSLQEVREPDDEHEEEADAWELTEENDLTDAASRQFDDGDSVASVGQSTSCWADLSTECGGTSYQHSRASSIMTEATPAVTSRDTPSLGSIVQGLSVLTADSRSVKVCISASGNRLFRFTSPAAAALLAEGSSARQPSQGKRVIPTRGRRAASVEPQKLQRSQLVSSRQPPSQVARSRARCRSAEPRSPMRSPPAAAQGPAPAPNPLPSAPLVPPAARPRIGSHTVARSDAIVPATVAARAAPVPQAKPLGQQLAVPSTAPQAKPQVPEAPRVQPGRPVWVSNGRLGDASQWCLVHPGVQPLPFAQIAGRAELRVCVRKTFVDVPQSAERAASVARPRRCRSLSRCVRR